VSAAGAGSQEVCSDRTGLKTSLGRETEWSAHFMIRHRMQTTLGQFVGPVLKSIDLPSIVFFCPSARPFSSTHPVDTSAPLGVSLQKSLNVAVLSTL
jgi:hypothetical protein